MGIGYFVTTPHNQPYFSQLRTRTKFKADCVSKKSFRTLETLGPTYPLLRGDSQLHGIPWVGFCQTLKFGVGGKARMLDQM